ncbi:uromodulin-like 1 [Spea bombifrons]|uniref:uromodulin-like 1 n=1 Tax=Spea bombifrons TaxID=233779 RepID=UPI00234AAF7A|nr:uromodulin-like 1 [Spea bombifrons]
MIWMAAALGSAIQPVNVVSPSGYHTCDYTLTKNVSKVVAFQTPYEADLPCPGWIPWRSCPRTYYKTEYRAIEVPETMRVTQCCAGYESLGDYCAISLERIGDLTSRPGTCPAVTRRPLDSKCTKDSDCPQLQKCCSFSNGSFCVSPAPPALDRNTIKYWYNGTITIKTAFNDLNRVDPGFLNHSRLLHSMITGELSPLDVSVHHLSTQPASAFTVQSHVLIGINQSHSLLDISSKMNNIVIRLPEVIDILIRDVDKCLFPHLAPCLANETCTGPNGTYKCAALPTADPTNSTQAPTGSESTIGTDLQPIPSPKPEQTPTLTQPAVSGNSSSSAPCHCTKFSNFGIGEVTAGGFHVSWSTDCPENHTYTIRVTAPSGYSSTYSVRRTFLSISDRPPGVLHTVNASFLDCRGRLQSREEKVKTDAQILSGTLRIVNWNLTEGLLNDSSAEYFHFVKTFVEEVKKSLSKEVSPEELTVEVESLSAGSIIVTFHLIISGTPHVNITPSSLVSVNQSGIFSIDPQSAIITDFDECLSPRDNDCDENAECRNLWGSYACDCNKPYVDADPSRPGRDCQDAVTGGGGTYATSTGTHIPSALPYIPYTVTPTDEVTSIEAESPSLTTGNATSFTANVIETSTPIQTGDPYTPGYTPSSPEPDTAHNLRNTTAVTSTHTTAGTQEPHTSSLQSRSTSDTARGDTQSTSSPGDHPANATILNVTMEVITRSTPVTQDLKASNTTLPHAVPATEGATMKTSSSTDRTPTIAALNQTTDLPGQLTSEKYGAVTSGTPAQRSTGISAWNTTEIHVSAYSATGRATGHTLTNDPKHLHGVNASSRPTATNYSLCVGDNLIGTANLGGAETPQSASASMSLKDASKVICEMGRIGIGIQKAYLKMMSISESSLYLGSPQCRINCSSEALVLLQASWEECGTQVKNNKTHMVVNTTLYINISSPFYNMMHHPQPIGSIRCVFQNDILMSTGYNPPGGFFTIIENLEGDGTFIPEFQLFNGDQPIKQNFTLSASDDIKVQIRIKTEDPQYKVVISECWATPSTDSQDPMSFLFIKDSCALTNTYTVIYTNGISSNATFQTKIFSFVNTPIVYLHCRLHVCKEAAPGACKPSCSNVRSVRSSGENVLTSLTRMGPLRQASRPAGAASPKDAALGTGLIALISVAVFVCVAVVVAILVCWHQRRTGNYNFKLKSKDVGYQVFYN